MALTVAPLAGEDVAAALPALAELRIHVFRDFPYLYQGSLENERDYLEHFAKAKGAVIVVARDGAQIVGAATAAPLLEHTPKFAPLFAARGLTPERTFYCGESVLLDAYRGRGIGHLFFEHREAHARQLRSGAADAFTHSAFCGVVRPADHPLKPTGYQPLDAFWIKRGYAKADGMLGAFAWLEVGAAAETEKPMQFWLKAL
jgi:GNAT superfamily N-acetyltransferase